MSDMHERNLSLDTQEFINERQRWLADAVEVVTGSRDGDPLQVFPDATETRDDAEMPNYSPEQEAGLREVAGRFGLGGETDVQSNAACNVVEAGKPWKIESELAVAGFSSLIYAGSPDHIIAADEIAYMEQRLGAGGKVARTQYEMARQLAELQPGFEPLAEDVVLPYGYAVTKGHEFLQEETGQLVQIGTQHGEPVYHLRIDREDFVNKEGENKFRYRPDGAALMEFMADVLSAQGDETSSIGILTSNTYASRVIDAVRAGLQKGRFFSAGMYGRRTLADMKGEPTPAPTGINQMPGELHVMAYKLQSLQTELNRQQ